MNEPNVFCNFCNEPFNKTTRIAHLLQKCVHSICQICLLNFKDKDINFECPIDKSPNSLKEKNLTSFPIKKCQFRPNSVEKNTDFCENETDLEKNTFLRNCSIDKKNNGKDSPSFLRKRPKENQPMKFEDESLLETNELLANFQNKRKEYNKSDPFSDKIKEKVPLILSPNKNSNDYFGMLGKTYNTEFCEEHSKELEAICENESCRKKVCLECGLFGKHVVR